jgi:uncharacterized protein
MSIGRRVVLGSCKWSTACVLVLIRAAPVVLIIFAFLLPANAQFWGNSWGGRQQQSQQPNNPYAQQPYNPYGGFGGDRQWGNGDYRQWGSSSPRPREQRRERPRDAEKEQPPDYSHAPPAAPRKDATVKIVVMGDANADWLAYGLEDAFSEKPEIGIVRKHRTDSGLIRYDQRRDSEWPQVAREIIAAEKPQLVVMMIGNNDRQTVREKTPSPAPTNPQPATKPDEAGPAPLPDLERQPVEQPHPRLSPVQARQAANASWEFQSEKWELAYTNRIDATIAALKSAGVPVLWVGLPSQRDTNASADSAYLNEFYRSQAEKAGIVYVDIWDGFVDEDGNFSPQGPDYLGQTRRLRTGDGVYFTKFGARKLAFYVEREIERIIGNKSMPPVALPVPVGSTPQAPKAKADGPAQRPAAGPVVPLTDTRIAPEELIGGGATPAAATGGSVFNALTKGEPLAAPSGRADDFSWPRGMVNLEPAAVEPAAPDTAAPDAGAKSAKPAHRKSAMDAYAAQTGREQKPGQRRVRPRLTHNPWAYERPNVSSFGSRGW